jgi:AcrR family transcriptional regulator
MSAVVTTRADRAKETRARLFRAAAELFAKHGYREATVDEIVRRAGVAKGTFFLHFSTKDAVIVQAVRLQTRAALKERERVRAKGGCAIDRLRAAVMMLGVQAGTSRGLSRAVLAACLENPEVGDEADALFDEVFRTMVDDAAEAQSLGDLACTPDAETIARVLMASYLGAAYHFAHTARPKPLVDVLTSLVDAHFKAFCKPGRRPS